MSNTALVMVALAALLLLAPEVEAQLGVGPQSPSQSAAQLRKSLLREITLAEAEGYVPLATREFFRRADAAPNEAEAKKLLLWAKGALLDLKLPSWARDVRYYDDEVPANAVDPQRGVRFTGLAGAGWAAPASFPGQWFRGHCRPTAAGVEQIEARRQEARPVGTYLSGGLVPITYALLPPQEEDWTNDFMRRYAGQYWHNGERWWGATGDKPGFAAWMLPHLDFAPYVGFDFIHLDEAWGGYPEAQAMSERHPGYLVVTNNLAMTYVDQPSFRFGWTAMGEAVGSPQDWDNFLTNLRSRALKAQNLTTWSYLYYELNNSPFYYDLAYGTAIATKTTDVNLGSPSRQSIVFAHRLRDYLFGPNVDVDVPQDAVRFADGPSSARTAVTRRLCAAGQEQLVIHLFNTDPQRAGTGRLTMQVDTARMRLGSAPVAVFAAPEAAPQVLPLERHGRQLSMTVPGVAIWGVVLVGPTPPQLTAQVTHSPGTSPRVALMPTVVPGTEFEVTVTAEPLVPADAATAIELRVPAGWHVNPRGQTRDGRRRFSVLAPPDTPVSRAYALTPVAVGPHGDEPSLALQVVTQQPLSFRLLPPCFDSPSRGWVGMEVEVTNNSTAGQATVNLAPPRGWQAKPARLTLDLQPGEHKRLPFDLTVPDQQVSFWGHRDSELGVDWQLAGQSGHTVLQVRAFPAMFSVYHEGPMPLILHGYPNVLLKGNDWTAARRELEAGGYVTLWLVHQDPDKFRPLVEWFVAHGGGVVWQGKPLASEACPVTLAAPGTAGARSLSLLTGDTPALRLSAPVRRFRAYYESATGFPAWQVTPRDWAEVTAIWGPPTTTDRSLQGSPAVVVSKDPERRIVYMASDLEMTTEDTYRFEERLHVQCEWYFTYYLYHLLAWSAGTEQ